MHQFLLISLLQIKSMPHIVSEQTTSLKAYSGLESNGASVINFLASDGWQVTCPTGQVKKLRIFKMKTMCCMMMNVRLCLGKCSSGSGN